MTSVLLEAWGNLESGFYNWLKLALGFKKQLGVIISMPEFSAQRYVNGLEFTASWISESIVINLKYVGLTLFKVFRKQHFIVLINCSQHAPCQGG